MFRFLGLTLALAALLAGTAHAQTMTVCVQRLGNRAELPPDCSMITDVPVGIDECAANAELELLFDGVPTSATLLDVWRSTGADCSLQPERDGTNDTCEHLTTIDTESNTRFTAVLRIEDLLECDADQPMQTITIYLLATDTAMFTGEVTAFTRLTIAVDTKRPDPPRDVSGGSGDTAIPVSWELSSSDLFEHRIYVFANGALVGGAAIADAGPPAPADAGPGGTDAGPTDAGTTSGSDAGPADAGSDGGELPSMFLPIDMHLDGSIGGMDAGGSGITCDFGSLAGGLLLTGEPFTTVGPNVSSAAIDGADLGLAYGDTAAVVVVAVDEARNPSLTSEPVCIQRVQTSGLCDRLGCEDDGCDCRAAPGSAGTDGIAPLAMFAGVLLLWSVRRRSGGATARKRRSSRAGGVLPPKAGAGTPQVIRRSR